MDGNLLAVTWATFAGVLGTGLGGLAGALGGRVRGLVTAVLGFTAGLMAGIVCFELLPEGAALGGVWLTVVAAAAGVALVAALARWLPGETGDLEHTGLLVLVAIALHNLPEGMAIGAGWAAVPALGVKLAIVIGLHDFPEGMAITAPMAAAGRARPLRQTLLALLTGVPTGLGALLGVWMGSRSGQWGAICLGLAAGAMLYVTLGEMVPRLWESDGAGKVGWQLLGLLAGLVVAWI